MQKAGELQRWIDAAEFIPEYDWHRKVLFDDHEQLHSIEPIEVLISFDNTVIADG